MRYDGDEVIGITILHASQRLPNHPPDRIMEANAMRAIVRNRYGSADVLRLEEVPKPVPKMTRFW